MATTPRYIIFAGVNGAGKSTLYQSGLWVDEHNDLTLPRVNPDEIVRSNGWNSSSNADQLKAGKIALSQIRRHLDDRSTFNQETTLTGRSIMRNIKNAVELGFDVHINYVGLESVETAIARIAHRVECGGHDINEEDVLRRYDASLQNLVNAFPFCKSVKLFDNTKRLSLIAYADDNTIYDFRPEPQNVTWCSETLRQMRALLR